MYLKWLLLADMLSRTTGFLHEHLKCNCTFQYNQYNARQFKMLKDLTLGLLDFRLFYSEKVSRNLILILGPIPQFWEPSTPQDSSGSWRHVSCRIGPYICFNRAKGSIAYRYKWRNKFSSSIFQKLKENRQHCTSQRTGKNKFYLLTTRCQLFKQLWCLIPVKVKCPRFLNPLNGINLK